MERFKVAVVSETPQETREELDRAGIPTIGPAFAYYTENPQGGTFGPRMTAILEAEDEDAAIARVREAVGQGCKVELAD